MDQPIRIYPLDLTDTYYITVHINSTTQCTQTISQALHKLQLSDSPSNYELVIGTSNDIQSVLLNEGDIPILALEEERKKSYCIEKRIFLRKTSVQTSILSLLTSTDNSSSSEQSPTDIDDLCKLNDLTEDKMLKILNDRFYSNQIYTYVGSILIAVNPYYFYSIYNPKYTSLYQGRHIGELSPHIFAIADDSYNSMLNDKLNQAVIISGESGAGKTESTKFLLHQLMQLSSKFEETSSLDLITLGTGPVLEVGQLFVHV